MRTHLKDINEVIHYWANQVQESGECGNVSFEGKRLYSYGVEIAAFREVPNGYPVAFIDFGDRRPPTTDHQERVAFSSNHYNRVTYNDQLWYDNIKLVRQTPSGICPIDIWKQYQALLMGVLESTVIPKYSGGYPRLIDAGHWVKQANKLAELFCLDVPRLEPELSPEQADAIRARTIEKALAQKAKENQFFKIRTQREEWLAGAHRSCPNTPDFIVQLRVSPTNPEIVEISGGASVSKKVCERLWKAWQKQVMPEDCSVGRYHLDKMTSNGLTIGGYEIYWHEMMRFAKVLWGDNA